jgi:2-oxo-hept-3-ene-1,7-dioate hydratase
LPARSRRRVAALGPLALLCAAFGAQAACPNRTEVLDYVHSYWQRQPGKTFATVASLGDAYCAQGLVAAQIGWDMGTPAGYAVALSSVDAQRRHGVQHPVRGFLFKRMFLANGASIPADFAAVPIVSADLIAVVKGHDFQRARDALELLEHIDYLLPFIQLRDGSSTVAQGATGLVATNLGTRYGVIGAPIPVERSQAFFDKLAAMRVVMTDAKGIELGAAHGTAVMGHPLNALHWLSRDLEYNAQRIQPGDRLSVGAFFAPIAAHTGQQVTVRYAGLPGEPEVSIHVVEPVGQAVNVVDQHACFIDAAQCLR